MSVFERFLQALDQRLLIGELLLQGIKLLLMLQLHLANALLHRHELFRNRIGCGVLRAQNARRAEGGQGGKFGFQMGSREKD